MQWVETIGTTFDEALGAALDQLGLAQSDAVYEVVEASTRRFGRDTVRIRARARTERDGPPAGARPGEDDEDIDAWSSFATSSPRWRDLDDVRNDGPTAAVVDEDRPTAPAALTRPVATRPVPTGIPDGDGTVPRWVETRFRDWRTTRLLGRGGCGYVVEARWENSLARRPAHLPERAAVKVSTPGDPVLAELMLNEARALVDLDHPGLVTVHDAFLDEGRESAALVMELAGTDLERHVDQQGPRPPDEALAIAVQLAETLAYLHGRGRIHNDLKCGNVLWCEDRWKLADFGLALDTAGISHAYAANTNAWLRPPESVHPDLAEAGERVRATWDVWAFGLLLHQVLTGEDPRPGGNPQQRFHASVRGDLRIGGDLDPHLRSVVAACLQLDPADRPADGAAVLELLTSDPSALQVAAFGLYGLAATSGPTGRPIVVAHADTVRVTAQREDGEWGPWALARWLYDDPMVEPRGVDARWDAANERLEVRAWSAPWSQPLPSPLDVPPPHAEVVDHHGNRIAAVARRADDGWAIDVDEAGPTVRGRRLPLAGPSHARWSSPLRGGSEVGWRDLSVGVNRWNGLELWTVAVDGDLVQHWWDGSAWCSHGRDVRAQRVLLRSPPGGSCAAVVLSTAGEVTVFRQEPAGTWQPDALPTDVGLVTTAIPLQRAPLAAVVLPDGRLEVFAATPEAEVVHTWQEHDGSWTGWVPLRSGRPDVRVESAPDSEPYPTDDPAGPFGDASHLFEASYFAT